MEYSQVQEKIINIVTSLKFEYKEAVRSGDKDWVADCKSRCGQMYHVCQELGIEYGKFVVNDYEQ